MPLGGADIAFATTLRVEHAHLGSAALYGSAPRADRAIIIRVAAYDWTCCRHIPVRRTDAEHGDEIARFRPGSMHCKAH